MMFRSHKDPLYYDAKANDKILVPVRMVSIFSKRYNFQEEELTEQQKQLLKAIPERDRGLVDGNFENTPGLMGKVPEDPVEAAVLKQKIKQ